MQGEYGEKRRKYLNGELIECKEHGVHDNWYYNEKHNQLSCRYCQRINSKKWNKEHVFERFLIWAKNRKMECDLNVEYIAELFVNQDGKCALSGIELSEDKMSLDRIDSKIGYIKGNIQWLDYDINRMKTDLDQQYFIELCELVGTRMK